MKLQLRPVYLSILLTALVVGGRVVQVSGHTPVFAQEEVPAQAEGTSQSTDQESVSPEATDSSEITTQPSNQAEIENLRNTYRGLLEEYRTQERQQALAKEQYAQLKTLASLETAVNTTQAVMGTRAEVLETYLTILQLTLQDQPGVEVLFKEALINDLTGLRAALDEHKVKVEQAKDRQELNTLATEFEPLATAIESKSYQVQSVLNMAKLQTILDKTMTLKEQLQAHLGTTDSAVKQARLERAFGETERTAQEIKEKLAASDELARKDNNHSRSSYTRFTTTLGPVYSGLSQVLSYLQETLTL